MGEYYFTNDWLIFGLPDGNFLGCTELRDSKILEEFNGTDAAFS